MGKQVETGPGAIGQAVTDGRITDEVCQCGHSIRQHFRLTGWPGVWAEGKGRCGVKGCTCRRFTWARFVFETGKGKG